MTTCHSIGSRLSGFPPATALLLLMMAAAGVVHAADLGQDLHWDQLSDPGQPLVAPAAAGASWLTRVTVPHGVLAAGSGALAAPLDLLQQRGHRLFLTLDAGATPAPGDLEAADGWSELMQAAAAGLGPHVVAVAPDWDLLGGDPDWNAYLFKRAAVALRGARPDLRVAMLLRHPDGERLASFYDEDLQPYVDIWAWEPAQPQVPSSESMTAFDNLRRQLDPAAPLWVIGLQTGKEPSSSVPAVYGRLAGAGAAALMFQLSTDSDAALMAHLRAAVPAASTPLAGPPPTFQDLDGTPLPMMNSWSFFDPVRSQVLVIVEPAAVVPPLLQAVVPTFDVSRPVRVDLTAGSRQDAGGALPSRQLNRTLVTLRDVDGPEILIYNRFATEGFAREDVEVDSTRQLTVDEILARHQEVDAAVTAAVETVLADARIDFHYTIAGSGASFDVAYDSLYMWDREVGAEYEYLQLYLNGSRWTRSKLPDLPLIQPEKVVTPPLKISLGRQYAYRLRGDALVDGRKAWRIGFEPRDDDAARYRGTAWIDKETFQILKQSVVQTGLEPPVQASEETSLLTAVPVPGGGDAYLPVSMRGQQMWTVGGANFVVNREVSFSNIRINDPAFRQRQEEAYASSHQILRDTDQGLRYLEKEDDGRRTVRMEPRTRSLFLLGGGFYNEAVDFPVPFAGIDYFDYNFLGRGQQVNFFIAGAANFLTWADPALGNSRLDLSASMGLVGFASTDRYYLDGIEQEAAEVKNRGQSVSISLGVPMGRFMKFRGSYGLEYENYQRGEDMAAEFIVPQDTLIHVVGLQWQLNRRGFTATVEGQGSRRVHWDLWGDPDPGSDLTGSRVEDYDEAFQDYLQWSVGLSQDFFLRAFQKIRLSATWLDGRDLDRFSRYQFSFFGERRRLSGYSGSGLRFDQGVLARVRYTFNIADTVTFDGGIDHGRVEDLISGDGPGNHTGIGFAGKFLGPWGLIMKLEYGYALRSDVPAVEGEHEAQLLFLKIF